MDIFTFKKMYNIKYSWHIKKPDFMARLDF